MKIRGMGWVTPLGADPEEVWARLMAGEKAEAKPLANPESGRVHWHLPVPPRLVEALGRQPRLRRSSPLSYFAAAAGLAALAEAGIAPETAQEARLAIIFAVASGSVVYTRRFYEQVTKQGAKAASPLLFPETVYNAPASHLAALLGLDGATYTLVGDSSVGLAALKMAEQLLELGEADLCLVAGTEELDWVLCEGYRDWRFTSPDGQARLFSSPPGGAVLAEGAAALLLAREGDGVEVRRVHEGVAFRTRGEGRAAVARVCAELAAERPEGVIGSANGSFADRGEAEALERWLPGVPLFCPKAAWGESLGAGALLQVAVAAQALRRGELPTVGRLPLRTALVLAAGLNQQASGAILSRARPPV